MHKGGLFTKPVNATILTFCIVCHLEEKLFCWLAQKNLDQGDEINGWINEKGLTILQRNNMVSQTTRTFEKLST